MVIVSAELLWYGWLGKIKLTRETLASVIYKSKLDHLSLLPSYNFSLLFNPGSLPIRVSIGQPVCTVRKHRKRQLTFSEAKRSVHCRVLHTHTLSCAKRLWQLVKQQPTPGCAIRWETMWKVASVSKGQFSASPTLLSTPGFPESPTPALAVNEENNFKEPIQIFGFTEQFAWGKEGGRSDH